MKILSVRPDTPEWLAARRDGIGASEIAAVLGLSPFESPFSLWWRKVEGWEFTPSPAMEWGHRLEDAIAAKFSDEHPEWYVDAGAFVQGPASWMLATPDRFVGAACQHQSAIAGYGCSDCMNTGISEPPHAVLELKTGYPGENWGEPGTAQIPIHYRAQVQWQMLCCDVPIAYVAALLGGNDYREYLVHRDDHDIAVMVEAAQRFRDSMAAGVPPDLDDHVATLATVKRLHPAMDGSTAIVSEATAAGYLRATRWLRLAKRARERYEALLRAEMGSAQRAVRMVGVEGRTEFVASRSVFDVDAAVIDRRAYTQDRINAPRRIDGSGRIGQ